MKTLEKNTFILSALCFFFLSCSDSVRFASLDAEEDMIPLASQKKSASGADVYTGQFEYTINQCSGPLKDYMESFKKNDFIQISVNKDKVQITRPNQFDTIENIKLTSSWNSRDQSLSRTYGNFGVGSDVKEDWRGSQGTMAVSEDMIHGQFSDVRLTARDSTHCYLSIRFEGTNSISQKNSDEEQEVT